MLVPAEVRRVAEEQGYQELEVAPNDRNHLLRFRHPSKKGCGGTTRETGAVKICVYFTTGKVSTSLEHPRAGKGQLQRTVRDMALLVRVFQNPRVHSNTGYHKTEETRKRHRENGLNPKQITSLACRKYNCTQVAGPPQDKNKLVVFKHPTGYRIRVWFNTGTLGVQIKEEKEVYVKKLTLVSIEKFLENPSLALAENQSSGIFGQANKNREVLTEVHQTSSSANSNQRIKAASEQCEQYLDEKRLITCVEKAALVTLATQNGFSLTSKSQPSMLQFKSGTAGPVLSLWPSKGTILVQGKAGLNQSTTNCTISDFLFLLKKHSSPSITPDDIFNNVAKVVETETETPLGKRLRIAREHAKQLYKR